MNQCFRPNPSNTGHALFYKMGKSNAGENIVYLNLIKQASWDNQTRVGGFSSNFKKPGKNVSIALTLNDCSQYIGVISNKGKYSTVHKSGNTMKSIGFSYMEPKEEGREGAFGLNISAGQSKFSIVLTESEARTLGVFLDEVLRHTARESIKESLAQQKNKEAGEKL